MEILENINSGHLHSSPIQPPVLNILFENYADAIFYKSQDSYFIANKKFYALNLIKSQKNTSDFRKIEFISRDFEENIRITEEKILKTSEPSSFKTGLTRNGAELVLEVTASPVNLRGKIQGVMYTVKDVTEAKMLETQRETFVASLGHDLKNPTLAQIRALELLLKGNFGIIPDEQRDIQEMVLDSCKYMNAMLSSLLATYRNQSGIVRLNCEKHSLVDIAVECIGEMIYLAKDKNVGISFTDKSKIKTFFGDKVQVKRVIMNLLSNGIKYAYKNSMIDITIYDEGDFTGFKFQNNSPYITPEKQKSIFARYVSFAEAHKELGIGLGLYASQKIIEAHEGEIFVESFENDRNIFGFKIPNRVCNNRQRTVIF